MNKQHAGDLVAVSFLADHGTAEVETLLVESGFRPGKTDDIFSFRKEMRLWEDFLPMVALDSSIFEREKRLVAFVPGTGNRWQIHLSPRERPEFDGDTWKMGTWFICRKIEPPIT